MYSRRTVEEVETIAMAGAVAQAAVTIVGIEPSTRSAATQSERRGKRPNYAREGGNDSELSSRVVAVLVFFSASRACVSCCREIKPRYRSAIEREREIVGKSGFEFRDSKRYSR